ncbi:MAG: DNA-3-methyladenine glycosylase 2 family protein [Candidatus Micrarchaeota archaeon]|nr:DNA-3-methyladenine glycosylase 2 family protein [Candidatus Micrarchaeota archaeon]
MPNDLISDPSVWNAGVRHLSKGDRTMSRLIRALPARKMTLHANHFGSLVTAIIFQQISGSAGDSIMRRFKSIYGGKVPTPRVFLATEESKVRGAGVSPQKYSYLKDLSERIEDGRLELRRFWEMPDSEVAAELDEVRGIGRWTAEMFLIFTLGRKDVLPVDDLGLRKALMRAYRLRTLPSEKRFRGIAKSWHPYCTIASLYLWQSLDSEKTGQNW